MTQLRPPLLTLENAHIARGERVVISNLNLTLNAGAVICVQGENGSGKSTLLRAASGFIPLESGARHTDCPIRYISPAPLPASNARVEDYLAEQTHLFGTGIFNGYGIEPYLHNCLKTLSSGWRQRVRLSALAPQPNCVWVLDECESPLDSAAREILLRQINMHCELGGAVLAACHTPNFYPNATTLNLARGAA